MRIGTQVVDGKNGNSVPGVTVVLEYKSAHSRPVDEESLNETPEDPSAANHKPGEQGWTFLGSGITDEYGRIRQLIVTEFDAVPGEYRMTFDTSALPGMPLRTVLTFDVSLTTRNYNIPLVLRPQEEVTLYDL